MKRKIKIRGIFFMILAAAFGMQVKAGEQTAADASVLEIAPIEQKSITIPEIKVHNLTAEQKVKDGVSIQKERVGTRNGTMSKAGQTDTYVVTPFADGTYRFEIAQAADGSLVSISVYGKTGRIQEATSVCGEGECAEVHLNAGETYTVSVQQKKGFGAYQMKIGYQKRATDISGCTEVDDSMEYKNQHNVYTLTAPADGRYRIAFEGTKENASFSVKITDSTGETVYENRQIKRGEGIILDGWKAEETYTIDVGQEETIGTYQLQIGIQKELAHINHAQTVKDEMQFEDQINRYLFSPTEEGSYVFSLEEVTHGQQVNMTIFDESGNAAATGSMLGEDDVLVLSGAKKDAQYEIQIQQEEGFALYQLSIEKEIPKELFGEWVEAAVHSGETQTFWAEAGTYTEQIQRTEALRNVASELEHYLNAEVTYEFGPYYEELTTDTIKTWILFDAETLSLSLDETKIAEYVAQFASRYDTYDKPREFQTYDGSYVTVYGGSGYGWMVDQYSEAAALKEWITQGDKGERRPIFAQEAVSFDNCDLGYDYVEIDLTNQYVFMYIGGTLIVSSPCVSGDLTLTDRTTPAGTYTLYYKQTPATLIGPDYVQPVTYWMPFNGGIGLHDATWRGAFGGQIYVADGSHGCINLPYDAAQTIYNNIYSGMPIICYYRY